jgi:hypothetical protein
MAFKNGLSDRFDELRFSPRSPTEMPFSTYTSPSPAQPGLISAFQRPHTDGRAHTLQRRFTTDLSKLSSWNLLNQQPFQLTDSLEVLSPVSLFPTQSRLCVVSQLLKNICRTNSLDQPTNPYSLTHRHHLGHQSSQQVSVGRCLAALIFLSLPSPLFPFPHPTPASSHHPWQPDTTSKATRSSLEILVSVFSPVSHARTLCIPSVVLERYHNKQKPFTTAANRVYVL